MSFALNEVEAMAKRATRGAGYPWGLAEEAAKATRWLCARRQDGCGELAALLEAGFAKSMRAHTPAVLDGNWQGQATLCPLTCGATLSDLAARVAKEPVILHDLAQPALILPFAAYVSRKTGGCVTIICDATSAVTDGHDLSMANPFPNHSATVIVQNGGTISGPPTPASRATPTADVWTTLNRFAHRTYAPATEQSRLLGAGAGLSDND
jgi:hypothetical protein